MLANPYANQLYVQCIYRIAIFKTYEHTSQQDMCINMHNIKMKAIRNGNNLIY